MKWGTTKDGRILFTITGEYDILVLSELVRDASGEENEFSIVDQVGQHIAEDDWEEFTKPELQEKFQGDIAAVARTLKTCYETDAKEIIIEHSDTRSWYSTINQARLNLESHYQLSRLELEISDPPKELIPIFARSEYYLNLQGFILEFMTWDS